MGELLPHLREQSEARQIGRIRMGMKAETSTGKTYPKSIDKFRLTSQDRFVIEAAAKIYGGEVKQWDKGWEVFVTEPEIRFCIIGDLKFSQHMEHWQGALCTRRCNTVRETINDVPCICNAEGQTLCKATTRVSVVLPDLPDIGYWRIDSRGFYAGTEFIGSMVMLDQVQKQTGRQITARMALEHRESTTEVVGKDGKPTTEKHKFIVPVVRVSETFGKLLEITENAKREPSAPIRSVNSKTGEVTEYVPIEDVPKQIATKEATNNTERAYDARTQRIHVEKPPKTEAEAAIRLGNPNGSGPITNSSNGQCVHCKAPAGKPHGTLCKLYKQPNSSENPKGSLLEEPDPFDDLTD